MIIKEASPRSKIVLGSTLLISEANMRKVADTKVVMFTRYFAFVFFKTFLYFSRLFVGVFVRLFKDSLSEYQSWLLFYTHLFLSFHVLYLYLCVLIMYLFPLLLR